ncbi:hypothetical protein [Desulfosporosinus sp.]|uniref:hypothetical protein n=1 Tax=Desulfosporosinus sp. TaxID=157907 RepID=UPI00231DB06D|nr:hypothetical protein [Desulfosporosinus sp.]MDA8222424.1 hypothetical protein [Desulfitobacterium hafniense]
MSRLSTLGKVCLFCQNLWKVAVCSMKEIGGIILICIGTGFIGYTVKDIKGYGVKKSWVKMLMFIIDVLGEGGAAAGLLLILVGLILILG